MREPQARTCAKCGIPKLDEEFYKAGPKQRSRVCRDCEIERELTKRGSRNRRLLHPAGGVWQAVVSPSKASWPPERPDLERILALDDFKASHRRGA